jgi:hypothetical protein
VSNINFININEHFPARGEDNDTQVFRDNFDTIKTNFSSAKTEIEDLQDNSVRTDTDNDFNANLVQNATFQNNVEKIVPSQVAISSGVITVEFGSGSYQIFTISNNAALGFNGFPTTSVAVGKVTLELYGDGTAHTVTFTATGSTVFKKSVGFPATVTVTSATDPVIIEVWQHGPSKIFLNYLGQFI